MNSQIPWPCVCILAGICILFLGILIRKKFKNSESWPKTSGVVVESTIQSEWVRTGSGRNYIVSPKVIYQYQVDGKKYTSSQLALVARNTANENLAQEKSTRHPVGQQVTVYYNPRKPEFATLEVGDPTHGKLPFGMIIVGTALAIFGIFWFLEKFK